MAQRRADKNFLCLQCKQVCAYSAQDARWLSLGDAARDLGKLQSVVRIEVSCRTPGCEAPIMIHALMAFDIDPVEESLRLLSLSRADRIGCGRVHFLEGSLQKVKVLDAYFDEDWQML